jgi:hypothetical protein
MRDVWHDLDLRPVLRACARHQQQRDNERNQNRKTEPKRLKAHRDHPLAQMRRSLKSRQKTLLLYGQSQAIASAPTATEPSRPIFFQGDDASECTVLRLMRPVSKWSPQFIRKRLKPLAGPVLGAAGGNMPGGEILRLSPAPCLAI